MWISNKELEELSYDIRRIIDGQEIDIRDNREGLWGILKNDIHTLASLKKEQVDALQSERDIMSETLTNISHQLKTPLTSMMIMADLLENAPPDKQTEFLSNIKIGLTGMEWLASALLKMAKIDAGAVEFSAEAIDSRELTSLALEPLKILLDIKNQTVEISGDTLLRCDKRWTAEALTNVVKNASEYSPYDGKIYIEAGMNPICKWISVYDSGEGISKKEMAGIFNRFKGSRSDKGYGIGLPLALAIMRGQAGDIEVSNSRESRENTPHAATGAVFTLKFYE